MNRIGQSIIQIKDGRVLVSRYLPFTDGDVTWEVARNAAELERAGVALSVDGHRCSPEIELRAEFEPLHRL